ncbi:hypothetical protein GCM10011609_10770 [Lentzea pudingi]|uniref:SnoaL-like domain-containing protein n=1 Tax=Lentzea pudingi TaxID=1789439 RepID=A0ABQ2HDE1_9PSEU|nr:nuclear transport factor 2 family protein [Lentzea pudingi]GGM76680.1 hypothetical protein GCM10011609_10770 [Lentzea pudingi]
MTAILNTTGHVTSVHRYYELVDAGDVTGLVNMFSPDATYRRPGYAPMVGHEEMSAFYGGARVIREGRHTVDKVVESAEEVAVYGTFNGVLHDGRQVDLRFSDFFEFTEDGHFARRDTFFFAPLV